jgi:divalent metal cation (Fe/Co/Zn/Cd) transporter
VKDWLDDKNILNLIIFVTKVATSIQSVSMVVIALTLDSRLDLLSGFILWFTAPAMKKPNKYNYPIGKRRMQPVVRTLFNKPCHFGLVESRLQI